MNSGPEPGSSDCQASWRNSPWLSDVNQKPLPSRSKPSGKCEPRLSGPPTTRVISRLSRSSTWMRVSAMLM